MYHGTDPVVQSLCVNGSRTSFRAGSKTFRGDRPWRSAVAFG